MELGVDRERRCVDIAIAADDVAVVVNTDEVRHSHQFEVVAKWVDPKAIGELWIPDSHVASNTLSEVHAPKYSKACGESLLAVEPLSFEGFHRLFYSSHRSTLYRT